MSKQWGHGFYTGQNKVLELYKKVNGMSLDESFELVRDILPGGTMVCEFYFASWPRDTENGTESVVVDCRSGKWRGLAITKEQAIFKATKNIDDLRNWFCT